MTKTLEDKIALYHQTLIKEREIKEKLVAKLKNIKEIVSRYRTARTRTPSKAAGIPFGLGSVAAVFMAPSNVSDNNAEKLLLEIKNILSQ